MSQKLSIICSAFAIGISAGFSAPATAQNEEADREICKIFPDAFLRACGGSAKDANLIAEWSGPLETVINVQAESFADMKITLPVKLPDLQEAQNLNYERSLESGDATGEKRSFPVEGCNDITLSIVRKDNVPLVVHGTGICFGFAINYFAVGPSYAGGEEFKFKAAISALKRDVRDTQ